GTTHADHFQGPIPVTRQLSEAEVRHDYESNTGHVIRERFKELDPLEIPGVLVAGHAPFTWGRTVCQSVENAQALDALAEMALGTYAISADKVAPLEKYILEKHYQRKHGKTAYYGQR
ncbi:MAG TPA: L-ribulose-5-phosphate 4-epimerase, partial [Acidobacteria bacterium]|nr:L-ribulose-5-phosphate 4-epimerase [Acidobacteriota bacterium]